MTPTRETNCPRCGYDLSGSVASWAESCPLDGVCPECGLTLDWGAVCNPDRYIPSWSFEHRPRRWKRAMPATLIWTIFPQWFFSRITMELPVVWRRLLLSIVLSAAVLHAGVFVWSAAAAYYDQLVVPQKTAAWIAAPTGTTPPANAQIVNGVYFVRAPVYMAGRYESWAKLTAALAISPATPSLCARAVGVRMNWGIAVPWATLLCIAPVLIMPASFLLLPGTFARISIRRVHLWRGLAYSIFWSSVIAAGSMCVIAALSAAEVIRPQAIPHWRGYLMEWSAPLAAFFILIYLAIFWWVFARRYLRLPNAEWVALLLLLVSILASLAGPAVGYYTQAISLGL